MALGVQIRLVGFMNIVKGYHCPVSWSYDGVQAEWSGWSAFISDPACSLELCEDHQLRGADNVLTRSVLGSLVSRLSTIFSVQHSSSDFFIAAVMHSVWWMSFNAARHSASPFKLYALIWQSLTGVSCLCSQQKSLPWSVRCHWWAWLVLIEVSVFGVQ